MAAADVASTWTWFTNFACRFPSVRTSERAIHFLARCQAAALSRDLSGLRRRPGARSPWYRDLERQGNLIDRAWLAAWSADPEDGTRDLIEFVSRVYRPAECALWGSTPLDEAVRRWNDGTVVRLAGAVADGNLGAGILCDALLDGGCADERLLEHFRRVDTHPVWCGALDAILRPAPAPEGPARGGRDATSGARAHGKLRPLAGVHLGSAERRVLLASANKVTPAPVSASRSAREVLRRALLRLAELEMIVGGDVPALTRLGRLVTKRFRREVEEGKRIRWSSEGGIATGSRSGKGR
jgi:hypothetical protein